MKINVTKDDIAEGRRANPYKCPIANAVRRITGIRRVRVTTSFVDLSPAWFNDVDTVSLPRRAEQFIDHFDNSKPVKPFSFNLKLTPDQEKRCAALRTRRIRAKKVPV